MEKKIYDKKTGIHYELQGDYYLPCLELPEQPKVEIGIWGAGVRWTPLPQAEAPAQGGKSNAVGRGSPVETSAGGRSADRTDRRDSE